MKKLLLLSTLLTTLSLSSLVGCSTSEVSKENNISNSSFEDTSIFTSSESSLLTSSDLSSSSTISSDSSSSSSRKSSSSKSSQTGYKINHSSATMTMGEELQLEITNNGTAVSNVTWTTSDNQLARVDKTGKVSACFFTSENEIVTITGKVSSRTFTCRLTINPRNDSIFNKCYYHSESVNQDENGHVVYIFVHSGMEANGTLLVNKTFEYDSFTNICNIKVSKSYTEGGVTAYYIGYNTFYWGDYQNGLFYGYYAEVKNEVQRSALFSFYHIGFSYTNHTIYLSTSTTYKLEESDWTTITTESKVAEGVFYRIQECSEYAEEKFTQYNFGVHLF